MVISGYFLGGWKTPIPPKKEKILKMNLLIVAYSLYNHPRNNIIRDINWLVSYKHLKGQMKKTRGEFFKKLMPH